MACSPIAQRLASPPLQLFVWLVGAAFSLAGALTIAELGAALPRAGGMFVYLSEAYGPLWGFLYGWAECTVILGAGNAAVAVLFAAYLGHFVPLGPLGIRLCAVGCIGGLTLLNVLGVREGVFAQNLMTLAKMGLCAALAAVAVGSRVGAWSHLAPTRAGVAAGAGMVSSSAFAAALLQPLWSFDGWVYAGCVGSEIKRPGRNLPLATIGSVLIVTALYLALNAAYLFVLGTGGVARSSLVAADTAAAVLGSAGAGLASLLVMLAVLGSLNGGVITGPRVLYAMAREGLFFRVAERVHPRFATPAVALLVLGVWSAAL